MKKIVGLILSLALFASFCACSAEESGSTPSEAPALSEAPVVSNAGGDKVETKEPEQLSGETVENQVLCDESDVKITATGLDKEGLFGPELKVQIENNTEKKLTFQSRNASVNGYMVETMFSSDVAPGKKANDSITFSSSSLQACGIETLADMEFSFHVFDESLETYLDTNTVQIKTSASDSYVYSFDDSGEELYSGNGIRIVSKGVSDGDSIFGPSLVVFIENKSGKNVTIQTRDTSVNGFMMDTIFSSEICDGKYAIDGITFMNSSIEESGIESIEEIECSFHIFGTDDWETIEDTESIVVKAK